MLKRGESVLTLHLMTVILRGEKLGCRLATIARLVTKWQLNF